MLEIVQAGQAGKTRYLYDMHRLRKRVFKDRMGWDVTISSTGLETDDFDLPEAVYILALDDKARVIGNWRMLPTSGPTMIETIWPGFLETIRMPSDPLVWETSRFAVDAADTGSLNTEEGLAQVHRATAELFCGLTELCLMCGIREIFTMYDMRIARLLKRLDCAPRRVSARIRVDDALSQVGAFQTDQDMLTRLRKATSLDEPLVKPSMLPPDLKALFDHREARAFKNTNMSNEDRISAGYV
jgi:N-acyl-L-homoserine lactone synthetase